MERSPSKRFIWDEWEEEEDRKPSRIISRFESQPARVSASGSVMTARDLEEVINHFHVTQTILY